MFYTYVLQSLKDTRLYIGHTQDLEKRLQEHNSGKVSSTRRRTPFVLLYTKEFQTQNEARWQEHQWKTGWGHKQLEKLLNSVPT